MSSGWCLKVIAFSLQVLIAQPTLGVSRWWGDAGKYLEIFARKNNLRNYWTSIGNEVTGTGPPAEDLQRMAGDTPGGAVEGGTHSDKERRPQGAVYGAAPRRVRAPSTAGGDANRESADQGLEARTPVDGL